jgi:hypothetical protein
MKVASPKPTPGSPGSQWSQFPVSHVSVREAGIDECTPDPFGVVL